MTQYHVAVDHLDPDDRELTTTYLGTCDQAHVDQVRAIAALPESERHLLPYRRIPDAFCVLRSDGDLDVYFPVDAEPFDIRVPDPSALLYDDRDMPEAGYKVTGPAYIDGAVRFGDQVIGGAMDHPESGPRFTWHSTESPAGRSYFNSVAAYLMRVASEPQVIYDPVSDSLGQFGPLTQSARALQNDGSRRTNREGLVNIQVEVLAYARSPWTKGFDPAMEPNFRKLLAAGRAYGIPDVWPAGNPPKSPGGSYPRPRGTWQSKPGHYDHGQVPGNSHTDFGACDTAIVPGKATSSPKKHPPTPSKPATPASPNAFPGASPFGPGANNAYVTRLGSMLVTRGGARYYKVGPGPKWGDADRAATRAFQLAQGWKGQDADGIPGPKTWDLLVTGKGKNIPPLYEPYPGATFFRTGRHSAVVTAMGKRLVAVGCGAYKQGPGPDWTSVDAASVKRWQKHRGTPQTGIPSTADWDALKVPNV